MIFWRMLVKRLAALILMLHFFYCTHWIVVGFIFFQNEALDKNLSFSYPFKEALNRYIKGAVRTYSKYNNR